MKHVLLVDDDPLILRTYGKELSRAGWQVSVAEDGLEALKCLQAGALDAIVLDLMMTGFSGPDVMKFLESQPGLPRVPAIGLSNAFMSDAAEETLALGVRKMLLKVQCTPSTLLKALEEVLANPGEVSDPIPGTGPSTKAVEILPPNPGSPAAARSALGALTSAAAQTRSDEEIRASVRHEFVSNAVMNCLSLRKLLDAFKQADSDEGTKVGLQALQRKVHLVTNGAGLAGCHRMAQLGTPLDALLVQLMDGMSALTPSVLQTVEAAIDGLAVLFQQASRLEPDPPFTGRVMVLDPDTAAAPLLVAALRAASLPARWTSEVAAALKCLLDEPHELLLVSVDLPGIAGADFCRSARTLPGYANLPVMFLADAGELEADGKQTLSRHEEVVVKPVLPTLLALKAILRLLRSHRRP